MTTRSTITVAAANLTALVERLAAATDAIVEITAEITTADGAVITLTTNDMMAADHGLPAGPIASLTLAMPDEQDADGYRPATPAETQRLYATLQVAGYPIGPMPEIGGYHVVYAPIVLHAAGNA